MTGTKLSIPIAKENKTLDQSIPKELFFTKGVGTHREQLHSFELALRDAGIENAILYRFQASCLRVAKSSPEKRGLKNFNRAL